MSGARTTEDGFLAEPSWTTAISEADAASRHLHQATAAMDRLSRELHALREWSDATARLELAQALTEGPDGGALHALLMAATDGREDPAVRATAEMLLERLTSALGLEPVGERGELLRLFSDQVAEFDVRGRPSETAEGERGLYCIVRPGWCVGESIVVRPLLEAAAAETPDGAAIHALQGGPR
jgi:hypothetical protein